MTQYTKAVMKWPGKTYTEALSATDQGEVDFKKAQEQFREYTETLIKCNVAPILLESDPEFPDGCFVEDTAVVTGKMAIICRPGHSSRLGEPAAVSTVLRRFFELEDIHSPGTVDGGDILQLDGEFLVAQSTRTNAFGAAQFEQLLDELEIPCKRIKIESGLHLKTGLSYIGDKRVVAAAAMADLEELEDYEVIRVSEEEAYAANCVMVNGTLIIAKGYPEFEASLRAREIDFVTLDMSEFRKKDGGISCLSILF